jgi:hypothetical protein
MSYFDTKQKHYTEILHLVDETISSGGSVQDVREGIVQLIKNTDDLKSQI